VVALILIEKGYKNTSVIFGPNTGRGELWELGVPFYKYGKIEFNKKARKW
jgi:hypothetical protein